MASTMAWACSAHCFSSSAFCKALLSKGAEPSHRSAGGRWITLTAKSSAPSWLASAIALSTAFSDNSEPSVATRMRLYMLISPELVNKPDRQRMPRIDMDQGAADSF